MRSKTHSARKWNALALLILGLAVAVFAWGLRYKLSLYKSAPVTVHHVSSAKLLSNRERPADAAVQIERATTPLLIAFAATSLLFAGPADSAQQSRWTLRRQRNFRPRLISEVAPQLFFRPPPSRR